MALNRQDQRIDETGDRPHGMNRRALLASGAAVAGGLALGPALVKQALAAARAGEGIYGPLQPPDGNGVMMPKGFTSRIVARANEPIGPSLYTLPIFPDGQATFRTTDGGWILVTNGESIAVTGAGASATRFDGSGNIVDAYRILGNTGFNCAGGPTPWGTWLSGEESDNGLIWECDPMGVLEAQARPLLGAFSHEAAAVDPIDGRVYLTEDDGSGCFYRFTPDSYPSLTAGKLEAAIVDEDTGKVSWGEVTDPTTEQTGIPTQDQVEGATRFRGGEGIWYARGFCIWTTKGDRKVWSYDIRRKKLEVVFDREETPDASIDAVDNVTVNARGDIFVCEDGGNLEIGMITNRKTVSALIRLPGSDHAASEICGACFDPSGTRMYFTSQRGPGLGGTPTGTIFEVTGPFRLPRGGQPRDFVYGPPAGELRSSGPLNPGADDEKPKIRSKVRKRIGEKRLTTKGLPVKVHTNEAAEVTLTLRSQEIDFERGEGGRSDRPRSVKLGTEKVLRERGSKSQKVKIRPDAKARKQIRKAIEDSGRPILARLTIVAVDGAGNRRSEVTQLRIKPR